MRGIKFNNKRAYLTETQSYEQLGHAIIAQAINDQKLSLPILKKKYKKIKRLYKKKEITKQKKKELVELIGSKKSADEFIKNECVVRYYDRKNEIKKLNIMNMIGIQNPKQMLQLIQEKVLKNASKR